MQTLLHAVVCERLEPFLAAARDRSPSGRGLPTHVERSPTTSSRAFPCTSGSSPSPEHSLAPVTPLTIPLQPAGLQMMRTYSVSVLDFWNNTIYVGTISTYFLPY